jgi:hypothetical protein
MRLRGAVVVMSAGLLLGLAWSARAQDDGSRALLESAIKAAGGAERIEKFQGVRLKLKGRIEILSGADFTQDAAYQVPDKFRQEMEMDLNGQKIMVVTSYDGKTGSIQVNGKKLPPDEKIFGTLKEGAYQAQVARLLPLRDKSYTLSTLGESQVNGKPVLGLRVEKKDYPDVNLFFDKASQRLLKLEHRTRDLMSGQEVTEERLITEYQVVDGIPIAKKVEVIRDGKRFLEAETLDVKFVERIDDSEFAAP